MRLSELVDPEIAPLLPSGPSLGDISLEELPGLWQERRATVIKEPSEFIDLSDFLVPGDPPVAVRLLRPKGVRRLLPCLYWVHGGSFIVGSHAMDDTLLERWCLRLTCAVLSVDYRLAPESRYPAALEDCHLGLVWLHEHAGELGVDASVTGVVGVSAGGALAAALALLARDRGEPPIAFLLLDAPCLDDRQGTVSSQWEVPVANPATIRLGWRAYLGDLYGAEEVPCYAAPARATDLSGLPTTLLTVGALDGLSDEVIDFAQRLNHAGVATELHVYPKAPHLFARLAPEAAVSRACWADQEGWLLRQLRWQQTPRRDQK